MYPTLRRKRRDSLAKTIHNVFPMSRKAAVSTMISIKKLVPSKDLAGNGVVNYPLTLFY
jgi:hypothetical protein